MSDQQHRKGRPMTGWCWLMAASLSLAATLAAASPDRIQPWPQNPYYWSYQGKPLLLLGASRTHNLFQSDNVDKELDDIRAFGGNYVRNTMGVREEGDIFPFVRGADGYDLDTFNPEYWEKFERLLKGAQARDIIVQVEIWDIWEFQQEAWLKNPYNPANHINNEALAGLLPEALPEHPKKKPNPFFFSVLQPEQNAELLQMQTRFVQKLLSISLNYPNVLYCIDNESFVTPEWALHWAGLVRSEAEKKGVEVELTEMWEPWKIEDPKHLHTIDHPQTYDFIDASQNSHIAGQRHYDGAVYVTERIAAQPRPINNIKIYGAATSRFVDEDVAISSFWKSLFAGHAAVRFHRGPSGLGTDELARSSVRVGREVFSQFDLFAAQGCTDELGQREEDEAYCLRTDTQLLAYFPKRKKNYNFNTWYKLDRQYNLSRFLVDFAEVRLPPLSAGGAQWYNIETGEQVAADLPGADENISPPSNEHWLLLIQ